MKKITILVLHLGYGGLEKAVTSLVNTLCHDYQIEIISTYKMFDKPAFYIDDQVKVSYLIKDRPNRKEFLEALKKGKALTLLKESLIAIKVLYYKKKKMIAAIKDVKSEVIISTRPLHNNWLGIYGNKKSLKIAWEHYHPNNDKNYIKKMVSSCTNVDYLVTVSKELTAFYAEKINNKKPRCIYISLFLDKMPVTVSALKKKNLISIGRLSREKGFLDLIDVFKLVHQKHPDWKLNIIGDGLEKEAVEKKINDYKLQKSIVMHGFKPKEYIDQEILNNSIYVMTSISESFGLVILEAMSYGIPCLAFDSAKGPLEIIDNNVNGYLISNRDNQEMAHKIINLIEDYPKRKEMGQKARDKAQQFDPDKVKKEWIKLIEDNT